MYVQLAFVTSITPMRLWFISYCLKFLHLAEHFERNLLENHTSLDL